MQANNEKMYGDHNFASKLNCHDYNGCNDSISDDQDQDDDYAGEDDDELLDEAMLAVASAEEYAAKIIKLQQACLTPLKEDLADWLNKIFNSNQITANNFMDKLDNGVIICKLAKIISSWCEEQLHQQNPELTKQLLKLSAPFEQQQANKNCPNSTPIKYGFRDSASNVSTHSHTLFRNQAQLSSTFK